jgi:hypothetical protein
MENAAVMIAEPTPQVTARVSSFSALFGETAFPLAIDTYQRGFVWGKDKIRQLIQDLLEFSENVRKYPGATPDYYMGTLLLHDEPLKERCFVIDGQQRLTALCVLHRLLTNELPATCKMEYRSVESAGTSSWHGTVFRMRANRRSVRSGRAICSSGFVLQ